MPLRLLLPPLSLSLLLSLCSAQQGACSGAGAARTAERINEQCCGSDDGECTSGVPTSCDAGCASVFLPFVADCPEMARPFSSVVALCEATVAGPGAPIPAVEYQKLLHWGFDTDFFKTTRGMDGYSPAIMRDLATSSTVKTLRLRSVSDVFGFPDGSKQYDDRTMQQLLAGYKTILPDIFASGLNPVISWVNKPVVRQNPSLAVDGDNFVQWWSIVAEALRDQPYGLSFNLFTEIAAGGLSDNPAVYNDWTKRAIAAIRSTGGNNAQRVIILGAPKKEAKSLPQIDPDIYSGARPAPLPLPFEPFVGTRIRVITERGENVGRGRFRVPVGGVAFLRLRPFALLWAKAVAGHRDEGQSRKG
jgi:hypothetical protein